MVQFGKKTLHIDVEYLPQNLTFYDLVEVLIAISTNVWF